MDPIFQSLLLSGGNGSGGGADKTDGGGRRQPRPSRYAQLIPREALRQPTVDGGDGSGRDDNVNDGLKKQRRRSGEHMVAAKEGAANGSKNEGGVGTPKDANNKNGNSTSAEESNHSSQEEDNIRVYKRDGATGQLELLPEEDYDLVYYSDDDDDDDDGVKNDESVASQESEKAGESEQNKEGQDASNEEKVDALAEKSDDTDDAMEVDEKDETAQKSQSSGELYTQDTIYIVKTPSLSTNLQPQEIDTASYSSSSSDELIDNYDNDDLSKAIPLPPNPQAKEASSTASTLAQALVSRTGGFDKLRPTHGLLESDAEKQKKELQKKKEHEKKKKKDDKKKGVPAPSPTSKGKDDKDLKTPKKKDEADAETKEETPSGQPSQQLVQSHKLISSLPQNVNILDGDSPQTLLQLSKMRRWQERHIEPAMQGVELDDWEAGIDWVGAGSDGDEEQKDGDKKKDAMDVDKDGSAANGGDFRPPEPFGGHPKRPRRTLPEYDDPIQLLLEPRNPRLEALDLSTAVDWEGANSDPDNNSDDESVNIPLILQSSVAGQSVATLLAPNPTSRPMPFEFHSNYQQRYEREMANDVRSTAELTRPGSSVFGKNENLERYKEARQKKREQMAKDKQNRVTDVMSALSLTGTGRRITSSLMGPGGAERTGRPSRHAMGSSSVHDAEYVDQLELVYNHTLVHPDLSLSECRQFHRPRLPLIVVNPSCPWQFQTRVILENKRARKKGGATAAADGSTVVGSYHAMMSAGANGQSKIRNEADLSPTIGDLVIMEYIEERPPLFMTKGTTCRIVNYYRGDKSRCPISAGGGDRPLRKRHGDKAASAKGPTPAGPSNRVERPPRLIGPNQYSIKSAADLIGIIGTAKKKKSKEAVALEAKKAKENAIDVLPEGVTEMLHQKVHGPFIGEVEEGKTQSGLISNLFAAPIFRHDSEPTDFLMVLGQLGERSNSSSGGLGVLLRPLPPSIYCVGQTEPRVKVFAPNTNDEKKFVNAFIPYQIARNIARKDEGLTFDDIKDRLFSNTNIPHGQLRIRIKQVANFERSNNGIYSLKKIGEDNFPGVDSLGRKVSPEGVAAYESQCAGIRRLQDLGVVYLYSGGNTVANVAAIMIYLNGSVQAAMERRLKLKKVLEIKKRQKSHQLVYFERAFEKLDAEYKVVKKRQEIAKFIYEELQLSPWNISGEFIDVHKKASGGAMMKLTGIGDPSGVGEAYNFLREADIRQSKSSTSSKNDGALNSQIQKITGTQNDLRKLTMKQMASLLRSYGMKDKQIAVLRRWDRVHVIRDLSTKAASDGMGDEMERFARGEKLRLSDQRQNYKQRIQEIWRRQVAALLTQSTEAGNELAARSNLAIGSSKDTNDVGEGSDADKEKEDGSNDSDSSEDDFFAEMEMEMTNTGEANRLVSGLRDNDGDTPMGMGSQELSKEAREFAALQRQRKEERAMQEGLDQSNRSRGMGDKSKKKFKVIRRKIMKTRPDGTQTVTFEFIVNRDKVEEIIAKKKQKEIDEKKRNERKRKKKIVHDSHTDQEACVGHAMFEDDDNAKTTRRSFKLKLKKETRVIHKKAPGPKKASHSKLTSGIKHSRAQAQENRKKKRIKQQEDADLYKSHVKGKGTSNRKERGSARERMPHVIFSDRLEAVRSAVEGRPNAGPFLKAVNRSLYPKYYEIILEPIDLATIREKNRKYDYKTADKFVADFELMKINAIKFNGKGSALANEAVEIWQFVKTTVEQNREEFKQMEEAVIDQMSGKKKKKAKSKAASGASSSSKAAPMNTASVLLDGIETQVNLGTNLSFGLGGDSDSDAS